MRTPVRILHVLGRLDMGGAESLVMNLYRNIDRALVQFDFMIHTNDKCHYEEDIERLGGKVFRISRYRGTNHFSYVKQWNQFIKKHDEFHIIHGHIRSTASIYLMLAKKYGRITIIHSHATGSRGNIIERMVKNLMQLPIRYLADDFFACSPQAAEWLFGKSKAKTTKVLKNGIELKKYVFTDEIRNKIRENELADKLVIGHVGSFTVPKNHKLLLKIFFEILRINKEAQLVLVGVGELENEIKNEAFKLEISGNVHFYGARDDVPFVLQGMDAFVFPSLFEGFGIAALEAQASGLPTHVSDSLPNEIKLTNLLYFHSLKDSPEKWAKSILESIGSFTRKDYTQELKKAGFDIYDQATWLTKYYYHLLEK